MYNIKMNNKKMMTMKTYKLPQSSLLSRIVKIVLFIINFKRYKINKVLLTNK